MDAASVEGEVQRVVVEGRALLSKLRAGSLPSDVKCHVAAARTRRQHGSATTARQPCQLRDLRRDDGHPRRVSQRLERRVLGIEGVDERRSVRRPQRGDGGPFFASCSSLSDATFPRRERLRKAILIGTESKPKVLRSWFITKRR